MLNSASTPLPRELVIYTDESDRQGRYYSNFYGGLVVGSTDLEVVVRRLEATKARLNLLHEVKWQRVTENYLAKYVALIDELFDVVSEGKVKIRVMFTQNRLVPVGLSPEQALNEFHLLYYQFLKHAFGLVYANDSSELLRVRVNLDKLPNNHEQNAAFKAHVLRLNQNPRFRSANVRFFEDQIVEVDSRDHVLLQCLDIVLGAMCFRLNDKHREKLPGQAHRGKRTRAKETLYQHIGQRIRRLHPHFNIGESTGLGGMRSAAWLHPYRHWKFVASEHDEHDIDNERNKPK